MAIMPKEQENKEHIDFDLNESVYISDKGRIILHIINEENLKEFSFDGIKRRIGMHQETLSRNLNRLEDQHMVEKTANGYRATAKAKRSILHLLDNTNNVSVHIPLIQTVLPQDIDCQQLLTSLRGRWFGRLRWLGYSEKKQKDDDDNDYCTSENTFKWITDDGEIQVDAIFSNYVLNIEAKLLKNKKEINDAIKVSHQLMRHIFRLYSMQQGVKL
jgi:DNA-binding transcriptional ArsR family regulator